MENLSPGARKHQAAKAEKHKKEFPFLYRYHEVTDIPNRHAEGGKTVVCCLQPLPQNLSDLDVQQREGPWLAPVRATLLFGSQRAVSVCLRYPIPVGHCQ